MGGTGRVNLPIFLISLLDLIFRVAVVISAESDSNSVVVSTSGGLVEGDKLGSSVFHFRGIPFASPPVGSLRFMPPVTPTPWRGVRKAIQKTPVCPQTFPRDVKNYNASSSLPSAALKSMTSERFHHLLSEWNLAKESQSEDCLYLNVFAPAQKIKNNGKSKKGTK